MGNSLSRYWIAVTLTKQLVNPTKVSYQLTSGACVQYIYVRLG